MIKEALPADLRMSCSTNDLLVQLTMNFLHYLSDMSNTACNNEGKKTITPQHVLKALKVSSQQSLIWHQIYYSKDSQTFLGFENGQLFGQNVGAWT